MIFIPVLLFLVGSLSIRLEESRVRVGVVGSPLFFEKVEDYFGENEGLQFQIAGSSSALTDQIMGKYHFLIKENATEIEQIEEFDTVEKAIKSDESILTNHLPSAHRMVAMILTSYMTIATIYGMKYHQDKRAGVIERFNVSVGKKRRYMNGFFLSNIIVTGLQILVILVLWTLFDRNFELSFGSLIKAFIFIAVVSNLYAIMITIISKSELMSGILGASLAVLLSILGGTFVAVENMPAILQQISVISPVRWLLQMLTS